MRTSTPSAISWRAISNPIPLLAPVTNAIRLMPYTMPSVGIGIEETTYPGITSPSLEASACGMLAGMDRKQLADFLRSRRARVTPSDVGLPSNRRRRLPGLRREEVAHLAGISQDYYARLEQSRSPRP